jgi:hypothetical protein
MHQSYRSATCLRPKLRDLARQSHEINLLPQLLPISIAPEAQRSLAQRFNAGKQTKNAPESRRDGAIGEIAI